MLQQPKFKTLLLVHETTFSEQDFISDPTDDILGIEVKQDVLIFSVGSFASAPAQFTIPGSSNVHNVERTNKTGKLSVRKDVSLMYGIVPRQMCDTIVIKKEEYICSFVEISFRDQYIGRRDMWMLKNSLLESAIYVGKKVSSVGVKGRVTNLTINEKPRISGIIQESTKFIFRSETAKFIIFVQMSQEMWEFDELDGELYFEKVVNGFLPQLFSKWKEVPCTHVLSIVLFARVHYNEKQDGVSDRDSSGRFYKDFYKVVVDNEFKSDWFPILRQLKRNFLNFNRDILQLVDDDGSTKLSGTNSKSMDGNILEAVNLALNPFDKHYVDRDLSRTGLIITVISPGTGIFNVDKKWCRLTTQRMLDNGVSLDLVCLKRPPLHSVPLFQFQTRLFDSNSGLSTTNTLNHFQSSNPKDRMLDKKTHLSFEKVKSVDKKNEWVDYLYVDEDLLSVGPKITVFMIPDWIDASYWSRDTPMHGFIPRCAMYEVQMMGFLDNGPMINVPDLDIDCSNPSKLGEYDDNLFGQSRSRLVKAGLFDSDTNLKYYVDDSQYNLSDHFKKNEKNEYHNRLATSMPKQQHGTAAYDAIFSDGKRLDLHISSDREDEPKYTSSIEPIRIKSSGGRDHRRDKMGSFDSRQSLSSSCNSNSVNSSPKPHIEKLHLKFSPSKTPKKYLRHNYANPFENQEPIRIGVNDLRWEHLPKFHGVIGNVGYTNWKSLCTPASLPLTVTHHPTADELSRYYQEYTYTVSPAPDYADINSRKRIQDLIVELIKQRLAQGYQLLVENDSTITKAAGKKKSKTRIGSESNTADEREKSKPFVVCLGDHIHKLYYDESGNNIEIKRYTRRINYNRDPLHYCCKIRAYNNTEFVTRKLAFSYPEIGSYNWNYLDHVISGYQEELTESLRFWRVRVLLVPMETPPSPTHANENLEEEEERLVGFFKFMEVIERARYMPGSNNQNSSKQGRKVDKTKLDIQLTTLNLSSLTQNNKVQKLLPEAFNFRPFRQNSTLVHATLSKSSSTDAIVNLIFGGSAPMPFKNRHWQLQEFKNVCTGTEIIDWILLHFSDVTTREAALALGNIMLIDTRILEHARIARPLLDGFYFYTPSKEYRHLIQEENLSTNSKNPPVQAVKKVALDVDPLKKSTVPEIAYLHYDSTHNAQNCYHLELHWLACTASLIHDTINSWSWAAEKNGFKMCEAPRANATLQEDDNPFQGYVTISFAVSPPLVSAVKRKFSPDFNVSQEYFARALLRHLNFVLDTESDSCFPPDSRVYSYHRKPWPFTQYIHRSGLCFLRILPDSKGLIYSINNLHLVNTCRARIQHSSSTQNPHQELENIFSSVQNFCGDRERLEAFWNSAYKKLGELGQKNEEVAEVAP